MSSYNGLTIGDDGDCLSLVVNEGDSASNTSVIDYGIITVNGGYAYNTAVNENSAMYVLAGTASGVTVSGMYSQVDISDNGTASDITISDNGLVNVFDSGTASDITVDTGGTLTIQGNNSGAVNNVTIGYLGYLEIDSGIVNGISGNVGSTLAIYGGKVTNVAIAKGGLLEVTAGSVSNITVNVGGSLKIYGGTATNITFKKGVVYRCFTFTADTKCADRRTISNAKVSGECTVGSSASYIAKTVTNVAVSGKGTQLSVFSGGTANKATVGSGSILRVTGGKATNVTVNKGGLLEIDAGTATTITVKKGGLVNGFTWTKDVKFSNFNKVSGLTVASGKTACIGSKISISNVTVNGKKTKLVIEKGGTASKITVGQGAELEICLGGKATGITVKKGGIINRVTSKSNATYSSAADFLNKNLADNTDNTWNAVSKKKALLTGKTISGWIGLKDAKDFIKIQMQKEGALTLKLDNVTKQAYQAGKLKFSLLMWSGSSGKVKTISLAANKNRDGFTSKNICFAKNTTCYVGVSCTDKNYYTNYGIKTGVLAS